MSHDRVVQAQKAIDVAPRRLPRANIASERIHGIAECAEQISRLRSPRPHILHLRDARGPRRRRNAPAYALSPEDRMRRPMRSPQKTASEVGTDSMPQR